MLGDSRVNFAISARTKKRASIQVESEGDVAAARAKKAAGEVLIERGANCCYAIGQQILGRTPRKASGGKRFSRPPNLQRISLARTKLAEGRQK